MLILRDIFGRFLAGRSRWKAELQTVAEFAADSANVFSVYSRVQTTMKSWLYLAFFLFPCFPGFAAVQVMPGVAVPLGDLRSDETRAVPYQIINRGTTAVSIRKVRSGCSCLVTGDYSAAPIPAGGTGNVTLRISGDKLDEGPFERTSIIEFNEAPPAILRFAGRSVHAISIQPSREILLPPLTGPEQAWCQAFTVTGNLPGGKRLVLGKPEVGPNLEVTVAEEAPSRYRLTVRPRLPQPLGALREEIRLPVAEPGGFKAETIRLRGQVGPRLLAVPALLDLPAGEASTTCTLILQYAGTGKPLTAADLNVTLPPGVTRQSATDLPEIGKVQLVLAFAPALRKIGSKGRVEVSTAVAAPVCIPYYGPGPSCPAVLPPAPRWN